MWRGWPQGYYVGNLPVSRTQIIENTLCMLSRFSCVWLFTTLWTIAHQAPLPMGFSGQEYWSGLPCPSPGDLPNPGTEPASLMSPALAGELFTNNTTCHSRYGSYISSPGCNMIVSVQYHILMWQLPKQRRSQDGRALFCCDSFLLRNEEFPSIPQQMYLSILSVSFLLVVV